MALFKTHSSIVIVQTENETYSLTFVLTYKGVNILRKVNI